MAWNNQGGGWQGGGDNRGPWGQGPSGSGGGGGGRQQAPDLEDLLKKGQERLKNLIPGGFGSRGSEGKIAAILEDIKNSSARSRIGSAQPAEQ